MAFEGFTESIVALKDALTNKLDKILNAINNVVDLITDKIEYLFIPSDDF